MQGKGEDSQSSVGSHEHEVRHLLVQHVPRLYTFHVVFASSPD